MNASAGEEVAIPRKSASALAMDKLKTANLNLTWFELIIVCPHMWWEIAGLSFLIGYLNGWSFLQFGVFSTIQTGNLVQLINNGIIGAPSKVIKFQVSAIFLHAVGGTFVSSYIMMKWKVREMSLAIILSLFIVVGIVSEVAWKYLSCDGGECPGTHIRPGKLGALGVLTVVGSIAHWTSKLGYVLPYQTGNMIKVSETLYKYIFCIKIDEKTTGDTFQNTMILVGFFAGVAVACALGYIESPTLLPAVITSIIMVLVQVAKLTNGGKVASKLKSFLSNILRQGDDDDDDGDDNEQDLEQPNLATTLNTVANSKKSPAAATTMDKLRESLISSAISNNVVTTTDVAGVEHTNNSVFRETFLQPSGNSWNNSSFYRPPTIVSRSFTGNAGRPPITTSRFTATSSSSRESSSANHTSRTTERTTEVELGSGSIKNSSYIQESLLSSSSYNTGS